MHVRLPGPTGLQQRVLPAYRAPFFDALAAALPGGLGVFAGEPYAGESILQAEALRVARWTRATNRTVGAGRARMLWQSGWRQWLERENPQAVVLEANPRYLSNLFILRAMRGTGKQVLGWSLGPIAANGINGAILRSFYPAFSAMIVYSRSGAEAFRQVGLAPERIFVAPNAVESTVAERLLRAPEGRAQARAELTPDEKPVVLFVGRLQQRKRVDLLIRACARASVPCRLVIVGDGPDRARLEQIAGGILPAARFTGDVRGDALGKIFLAADLFVMPGTGGLALQEALLYGKPVAVAEADGSQADLVRPGENGWILPPGEEDALVAVLREALGNPIRLNSMGEASRRIVRETATMEKMVAGFVQALQFCMQ